MKFTIKFIIFGFFYLNFRLANILLFWRGIPNFLIWLQDTKRAERQIIIQINVILFGSIWYFSNWWIMIIFASVLTLIQYLVWQRQK
jgi:hypothetical protein